VGHGLFRALVAQSYLLILRDIALNSCLILSFLLGPIGAKLYKIRALPKILPQIDTASSCHSVCVESRGANRDQNGPGSELTASVRSGPWREHRTN